MRLILGYGVFFRFDGFLNHSLFFFVCVMESFTNGSIQPMKFFLPDFFLLKKLKRGNEHETRITFVKHTFYFVYYLDAFR